MPLYQKSVLNKYLNEQDKDAVGNVYQTFMRYFHNPQIQQNIRDSKEEQFQEGFLRELFVKVFGYTLNPDPDFDLTTEFKNQTGAQKADGAILKDGKAVGVIELKSTKTKDLESVRKQAFDYKANQPDCTYVITSNFQKLRFYINDAVEFEEFDLFILSRERFEVLYLCLSSDSILSDLPLKIKNASLLEEEQITKKFYADYSLFKKELFEDMVERNLELDGVTKLVLYKKTQKLLDRFLFIFFAEDRGLLPPNSIARMIGRWKILQEEDAYKPLYDIYKQYFGYLNTGRKGKVAADDIHDYNGGLFLEDELLDQIEISDEVLFKHTSVLTGYDFESQVDVNILGHIFEHSLNEIESTTAELEGVAFDKQKSKRKKDGVFYTPKYITKYIVDNTVGKLCEEKKKELGIIDEEFTASRQKATKRKLLANLEKYRAWLLELTICDPACGSGAFLNQALDFLINEHYYIDELKAKLFGSTMVFQDVENKILENNIFGVDINEESVDIARLSLWLRTAHRGRKLTTLNKNIKCGNSLIDDPEVAGDKAFNWEEEFPEVFAEGGFDVVIGNPPYGASFSEQEKDYVTNKYKGYQYKFESYLYFYEKGIDVLKYNGFLSLITPELFLRLEKSENIRRLLFDKSELIDLKFYGESVFEDVKVNSVIVTLAKRKRQNKSFLIIPEYDSPWDYNFTTWKNTPLLKIEYEISPVVKKIIEKIDNNSTNVGSLGEVIQGLTPYDSYRGHSKELIKNRGFHFNEKVDESCGKWLDGKNVNRYCIVEGNEWLRYGNWLAAPREQKFFEGPRLLFREVPGQNKRIQTAYTETTYYHGHSITPFILSKEEPKNKLFEILGFTNSKLLSWIARYKSSNFSKNTFPKLNPKDIKQLPISKVIPNDIGLVDMVSEILKKEEALTKIGYDFLKYLQSQFPIETLSNNLQNWYELEFGEFIRELNKAIKKSGSKKLSKMDEMEWMEVFETKKAEAQSFKTEIDRIDREIDRMVFELYGLTEEEIRVVEES